MTFKVIQGRQFWYQSKAHMQLPISDYSNLHHISHRFQIIADYWSNLRFRQEVPDINSVIQAGEPLNSGSRNLALKEPETSLSYGVDMLTDDYVKYDAFRSWRPNGICANLVHHPPATSSARSATGCVAHGLGFLPTTSHTRDDETRRIDGSVHDCHSLRVWQTDRRCNGQTDRQTEKRHK